MKPHIRLAQDRLWECRARGTRTGLGFTAAEAYAEWWALVRASWLADFSALVGNAR